jgi:hypothetical protein
MQSGKRPGRCCTAIPGKVQTVIPVLLVSVFKAKTPRRVLRKVIFPYQIIGAASMEKTKARGRRSEVRGQKTQKESDQSTLKTKKRGVKRQKMKDERSTLNIGRTTSNQERDP